MKMQTRVIRYYKCKTTDSRKTGKRQSEVELLCRKIYASNLLGFIQIYYHHHHHHYVTRKRRSP